MNYWKEAIEAALDDAGLKATTEQVETMTKAITISHDQYGMAFGHDCIPNPLQTEIKRLTKELETEQRMIFCKECKGTGTIYSYGGTFQSVSQCDKCRGKGKHLP